jgi:hypothetical protein
MDVGKSYFVSNYPAYCLSNNNDDLGFKKILEQDLPSINFDHFYQSEFIFKQGLALLGDNYKILGFIYSPGVVLGIYSAYYFAKLFNKSLQFEDINPDLQVLSDFTAKINKIVKFFIRAFYSPNFGSSIKLYLYFTDDITQGLIGNFNYDFQEIFEKMSKHIGEG